MNSNRILSKELSSHNIETILNSLGIDKKGTGWKTIKSPLRDEKNASFGINLDTGAFKDHGTDDSGDIVTLAERMLDKDNSDAIKWIREQANLNGALYEPAKRQPKQKKEPETFWSDDTKKRMLNGQKKLTAEHKLVKTAKEYDQLEIRTLKYFGAAIVDYWYAPDKKECEWLALPYDTGIQLYRRKDGEKVMYAIKGSKPSESFFGSRKIEGDQKRLIIAKSPRECMLLTQLFNDSADVIGLATGEQGNVSPKQFQALTEQISESEYSNITTILDCDSEAAEITARSFAKEVQKAATELSVSYVNLYEATGEKYKDITDAVQNSMAAEELWPLIVNANNAANDTSATCQTIANAFDVASAPPVPAAVYENLPKILKTRCSLFEKEYKKDVFLISALPVIAAQMPNVLAGHLDGYYTPDMFVQIVANPGTGKGAATRAKKLGYILNEQIIAKSKAEIQNYFNLTDEQKEEVTRPELRSLYIAANSSSRGVYDTLDRNGGSGLIFENEIDTLLNATKQDWGDFSDIVRKSFHHESISINRKDERFWIDNPRLSICLTGTFDQFKKMFESAENGHFSRYGLYTFDPERVWQSHRPTKKSKALAKSVESASAQLHIMNQMLEERGEEPLYIDLTDDQWQNIDDTFADKMQIIEDLDLSKHLHASNNRSAVLALRMVSIFTVLRAFEEDANQLAMEDSLTPTEADMKAAILLADNFIKHAFRLFYILPDSGDSNAKGERYKKFMAMLPNKFETANAMKVAENLEIPERTAKRWLSNEGRLKRLKRGHYEKQ